MKDLATEYDSIVIGAGVAGCCVARELSRYRMSCAVLESGNDVAFATSRANSGIVHAGFDPSPGSNKARYCARGARMFADWQEELEFAYLQNGSLVLAFTDDEQALLHALVKRAQENDVFVELLNTERLRELEPAVSPDAIAALHAPHSGICDPYGLTFAAAENAAENGTVFLFGERVVELRKTDAGFSLQTASGKTFSSRVVVNAAGIFADELNNMLSDCKLSINPVRGDYLLYDTPYGSVFSHTMFQAPSSLGKGVLVAPTVHGNLLIGPSALKQESKTSVATSAEGLEGILLNAQKTWPEASLKGVITNFAGLRAKGNSGDFVVGEAPDVPGFFNIACFESPGLTAAPAVATTMAEQVAQTLGADLKSDFNPRRARSGHKLFAQMNEEERAKAIAGNPDQGQIVCRCCNVSRADIIYELEALLPVLSLDTLKWRTHAMMGRCHSGFCAPEIMDIVHKYTGLAPEHIDKRLPNSPFVLASSSAYSAATEGEEKVAAAASAISAAEERATAAVAQVEGLPQDLPYDVIVIGAGAAGMAAAIAAQEEGASRVALLDRESFLGGILRQCIHNGFGLTRFKRELTGPEYASQEASELFENDLDVFLGTTVLSLEPSKEAHGTHVVLASNKQGLHRLQAKSIVLATGSRERGQGALNLAGSRPAGVFSAGSAQALINLEGCLPGRKIIIQGSGDIGLIMARRCLFSGAEVSGVFARSSKPSGLRRNVQQCLNDFGIPFFGNRVTTRLEGEGRLEAVWISKVDPNTKQVIEGSEERWPCDTLLLSIGLLPENELALAAGIEINTSTGGPVVTAGLETSVPGIFSCGNALHIHDLADHASEEGAQAGRRAAQYALKRLVLVDGTGDEPIEGPGDDLTATPEGAVDVDDPDLQLTCVRCPKGCVLSVMLANDGSLERVTGEGCKLGLEYATEEVVAPKRIVTASLQVAGSLEPLSVKTEAPVAKEKILDVLTKANALRLEAPIVAGSVLSEDIADTGVALVATKSI